MRPTNRPLDPRLSRECEVQNQWNDITLISPTRRTRARCVSLFGVDTPAANSAP
jgi:hypothetical protein